MQKFLEILAQIPFEMQSLPLQVISSAVARKPTNFNLRAPLNLPLANIAGLGNSQLEALEMALSNAPISLISGIEGTGKTHIGQSLAEIALVNQKKILILSKYESTLDAYQNSIKPILLSSIESYQQGLTDWLRNRLASTQINYLPLNLLPDPLVAKIQDHYLESLITDNKFLERLITIFPEISSTRLKLCSDRLTKLLPFLQQQLALKQRFSNLSEESIKQLSDIIAHNSPIPIVGTVTDLWKANLEILFDLVIVEDAHTLNHGDLVAIAKVSNKLVLLGIKESFSPFSELFNMISPSYRMTLNENFRINSELAQPIYKVVRDSYLHTPMLKINNSPLDGKHRLVWQDIPSEPEGDCNQIEGAELLYLLQILTVKANQKIGILSFYALQVQWLQENCPDYWFDRVYIGTAEAWAGRECQIMLISCVGYPERVSPEQICIALTRASDAVVLFGNQRTWEQSNSLISKLFQQPQLYSSREVSLV